MATPVIAAVNGPAAGVGLVLACYCDLRFAAAGAKLTTSAPRAGPARRVRAVLGAAAVGGPGPCHRPAAVVAVVLAEEAAAIGLVNRVLPPDELLPATYDYARALAPRRVARLAAGDQAPDLRGPARRWGVQWSARWP